MKYVNKQVTVSKVEEDREYQQVAEPQGGFGGGAGARGSGGGRNPQSQHFAKPILSEDLTSLFNRR